MNPRVLLPLLALASVLAAAGCGRKPAGPTPSAPVASAAAQPAAAPVAAESTESAGLPIGNRKDADGYYLCPVKGIPIRDLENAQTCVHDGILFYLDCMGAKNKFRKSPEAYLSGEIAPKDCGGQRECVDDQPEVAPAPSS